jgi:putative transposase
MMQIQIKLNKKELLYLGSQKRLHNLSVRKYNRINILLLLNKGKKTSEIEDFLDVDRITVWRTKSRYLEQGVEKALAEEDRSGQPKKYNTDHESELAALACGPCPEGRERWTIRLLTQTLKSKSGFETVNTESVRLALKKMNVSLG